MFLENGKDKGQGSHDPSVRCPWLLPLPALARPQFTVPCQVPVADLEQREGTPEKGGDCSWEGRKPVFGISTEHSELN